MKRRRRAFKLSLFLLAGAIINVAVAWGCAYMQYSRSFGHVALPIIKNDKPRLAPYVVTFGFGSCCFRYYMNQKPLDPRSIPRFENTSWWPYWHHRLERGDLTDVAIVWHPHGVNIAGWPMFSFSCVLGSRDRGNVAFEGILINGGKYKCSALPLRPIWPGFAINTIFYAAVLWVLVAVPVRVRRWRRNKRGQCAPCGYSLTGVAGKVCPECGSVHNVGDTR